MFLVGVMWWTWEGNPFTVGARTASYFVERPLERLIEPLCIERAGALDLSGTCELIIQTFLLLSGSNLGYV